MHLLFSMFFFVHKGCGVFIYPLKAEAGKSCGNNEAFYLHVSMKDIVVNTKKNRLNTETILAHFQKICCYPKL